MLKFKDPSRNKNQMTSTMLGQGFTDAQMAIMADDFARYAEQNKMRIGGKLMKENKRVIDVGDSNVSLSQDYLRKQNIYKPDPNAGGYIEEPYTFEGGELVGRDGIDSVVGKYGQDYLSGKLNVGGGINPFSEQQPGQACNTYATCIAQQAKSTAIADYDMFDYGLGKKRTIRKGQLNPVTPYNQEFNKNMANAGYEYFVPGSSEDMDIGTNILGANVNYNAELQGGDIGRMGFGTRKNENDDVIGTDTSHATIRQPDGSHIYNSGRLQSGLKKDSNIGAGIHVYARYVGDTRKLKEDFKRASFTTSMTKRPLLKTKPISLVSRFPKITGSLLKK